MMVDDPEQRAIIVDTRVESSSFDQIPWGPFQSGTMATFKSGTVEGAVNVPLMRPIAGNSPRDWLKRMNSWLFILEPIEGNPNFADLAKERLPKDRPLILFGNRGGDISAEPADAGKDGRRKPSVMTTFGYTQELKAAYELLKLGYTKLYILGGGIGRWEREEGRALVIPELPSEVPQQLGEPEPA